jgi:hypothetical protein
MHRATAHTNCASIHSPPLTKRLSTLRSSATTKSNAFSLMLIGGASSLACEYDDDDVTDVGTDNGDGDDADEDAGSEEALKNEAEDDDELNFVQ